MGFFAILNDTFDFPVIPLRAKILASWLIFNPIVTAQRTGFVKVHMSDVEDCAPTAKKQKIDDSR